VKGRYFSGAETTLLREDDRAPVAPGRRVLRLVRRGRHAQHGRGAASARAVRRAPERRIAHVETIKRLEHEADQVTHEVVNRLDRTFITPLDREDILELASDLDDVMDAIDGTAAAPRFSTWVSHRRA